MEQVWELQTDTKNSPQSSTWQKEVCESGQGRELVLVSGKWWEDCPAAAFCAAEGKKYKVERKQRFVAFVKFFLSPLVASVHFLQFWHFDLCVLMKRREGLTPKLRAGNAESRNAAVTLRRAKLAPVTQVCHLWLPTLGILIPPAFRTHKQVTLSPWMQKDEKAHSKD